MLLDVILVVSLTMILYHFCNCPQVQSYDVGELCDVVNISSSSRDINCSNSESAAHQVFILHMLTA